MNLCEHCQFIKRSANGTERFCTKVNKFDTFRTKCYYLGGPKRRDVVIKLNEKIMLKNIKYSGYMLESEVKKYITAARIKNLLKHEFIKLEEEKYILARRGLEFIQPKKSNKRIHKC